MSIFRSDEHRKQCPQASATQGATALHTLTGLHYFGKRLGHIPTWHAILISRFLKPVMELSIKDEATSSRVLTRMATD